MCSLKGILSVHMHNAVHVRTDKACPKKPSFQLDKGYYHANVAIR